MMWNLDAAGWLAMGAGMLVWVVLLIVVIWLVVRALTVADRPRSEFDSRTSPEDILRERFAHGEIDTEELNTRLAALRR